MQVAIAHYIQFKYKDNTPVPSRSFQNFFVNESRTLNEIIFQFAPFKVTGNISSKGGDTATASLITVPNPITVGVATEAVLNYFLISIRTVLINATTLAPSNGNQLIGTEAGSFTEAGIIANELWSCSNLTQDYEKITISLSSPIDAARKQIPRRVLSQTLVGSVPPTGNVLAA